MFQDSANRKKIIGAIISTSLFVFWILVDLYIFPIFGLTSYILYEVLAYGSWTIIALVCFGILAWAGCFSLGRKSSERNESIDLAG
ncbi:MAG: hypothetical protein ACXAAO_13805 [Candidatus Thorarchaeota archaeon]|jgi:hypothetical protein